VELVVSARALHELVVEPGLPLADLDAVQAYAQQQFAHYFGAAAQRFAIAPWRVGEAAGSRPAWAGPGRCCAGSRRRQVRLHAVRPAWAAWLASLLAATRAARAARSGTRATAPSSSTSRAAASRAWQSRRVQSLADLGGDAPLAVGRRATTYPQPGPRRTPA
jgi:hypothetical protein